MKLEQLATEYENSERKLRERIRELSSLKSEQDGIELRELQQRIRQLYGMAQIARETAHRLRKYYDKGEGVNA